MVTTKKSPKKMDSDAKKAASRSTDSTMRTNGLLMMTYEQVAEVLGVSRETVWRRVVVGKMPKPVKLGYRTVRFRRQDIEEWVAGGCKSNRAKKVG